MDPGSRIPDQDEEWKGLSCRRNRTRHHRAQAGRTTTITGNTTLVGKNLFEFLETQARAIIKAETKKRASGEKSSYALEILRPDREKRHLSVRAIPYRDENGYVVGFFAIFRDITQHITAKDALKVEKAYLEQLFESAQEAIVMADNEHIILKVNNEFLRLFGYRRDEVIGQSLDGLEATRHIREKKSAVQNPEVPIVAMTAHAMKGDRKICLEADMNDYISKPVKPEALKNALQQWLFKQTSTTYEDQTVTMTTPNEVFDKAELLDRVSGDEEVLQDILNVFLEDVDKQLDELRSALKTKNYSHLQKQPHTLKGAAGNVGAKQLQHSTLELEKAAPNGNMSDAFHLIQRIEVEFESFKNLLIESNMTKV